MKLRELDFHVTNRCNLTCIHCCYDSGQRQMEELTTDEVFNTLIDAKKVSAEHFHITGGEPLLRKDLFDIISFAVSLGYCVELLSNGILINKDKIEKLASIGLDSIGISLDGDYKAMKTIRGITQTQYSSIVQTISNCLSSGLKTKVNSVVFPENISGLEQTVKFVDKLGVNEHRIYYFSPIGRGQDREIVPPLEWYKFVKNKLIGVPHSDRLFVEFAFDDKRNFYCRASEQGDYAQIMCDGKVFPCAVMTAFGPIGDLKQESFDVIWNDSERWKEYCRRFSSFDVCPEYSYLISEAKGLYPSCPCTKVELKKP